MGPEFRWTAVRERAALLLAQDEQPDREIVALLGIGRGTLGRWKDHPVFAARVQEHVARLAEVALKRGIAQREKRVAALDDRWQRMQRVIAERADDPAHAAVPGWQTGLLVHQVKGVGAGDDFERVDQFAVDTGLLKELRAHEEQAAKELGQWVERRDDTVTATDAFLAALREFGHGARAGS
jgi:hypothetical protein